MTNWTSFARKHDMLKADSISASVVAFGMVLASKYRSRDVANIINLWLNSNYQEQLWLILERLLPIEAFSIGKDEFIAWPKSLRKELFSFLSANVNDPSSLMGDFRINLASEKEAKAKGMIFTPPPLADLVVREALSQWKSLHRSGRSPQLIADISCGTGAFLLAFNNYFNSPAKLIGIDSDRISISFTNLLNSATGSNWVIECYDPLLEVGKQKCFFAENLLQKYDLLIGNPPYVRSQLLSHDYKMKLKNVFPDVTKGNYDLSTIFIDHALKSLSYGGIASYILSSKFMTSSYGRLICNKLAKEARVISVTDFHDAQLFAGRTTYICILVFSNYPPVKQFLVNYFINANESLDKLEEAKSYSLPIERLSEHPWDFSAGNEYEILGKLRDKKHPLLTDIFDGILQGIRTGANHVFVLKRKDIDIEADLLRKFVSGGEIRTCRADEKLYVLLFPYRENSYGMLKPYAEDELKKKYPKAWNYLVSNRHLLSQRDLDPNASWYTFSRNQNLDIVIRKKLLVREMMPRGEFAYDLQGEIGFCSGYALIADQMSDEDLILWTAVMCTPTMEFALRNNGTQLHSGWFRLLKHHLKNTRLPSFDKASLTMGHKLAYELNDNPKDNTLWLKLDDLVASSFGLSAIEHQYIRRFIGECHKRSCPSLFNDEALPGPGPSDEIPNLQKYMGEDSINKKYIPVELNKYDNLHCDRYDLGRAVTFQFNKDIPIHRWYQFTQGFSEQLVISLINELKITSDDKVLDPFAGCGTTLLTCQKKGIDCTGVEISPLMAWVSKMKTTSWDHRALAELVNILENSTINTYKFDNLLFDTYFSKAFSKHILAQLCGIMRWINGANISGKYKDFLRLGVISIMEEVSQIRKHGSHYRYLLNSSSVGLRKLNIDIINGDSNIMPIYLDRLNNMINDIEKYRYKKIADCNIICGSALQIDLPSDNFDAVITSPPYLNRNCYIAQQKAEMAILGLLKTNKDYRDLVKSTMRSHVESSLGKDPITTIPEVEKIISAIELSTNNNIKIPHMVAGYFEDIKAVLKEMRRLLRPNARMAFVVGNSRWGGIVVPVDHILLLLGEQVGFIPEKILITRLKGNSPQQMRRYGRIPVRESIVIMRKES